MNIPVVSVHHVTSVQVQAKKFNSFSMMTLNIMCADEQLMLIDLYLEDHVQHSKVVEIVPSLDMTTYKEATE